MISPGALLAQGTLTPPGGPAESMRTLTQIEPRTPISSLPFSITAPGAYYLTRNVETAGDGITISSSQVTLDLNGFTLKGIDPFSSVGLKLEGAGELEQVVVKNGHLVGFKDAVAARHLNRSRLSDLTISAPGSSGIDIIANSASLSCDGNVIERCAISATGFIGIRILCASGGSCDGNLIRDCTIAKSQDDSIRIVASSDSCAGNRIIDCSATQGGRILLSAGNGVLSGNLVDRCTVSGSSGQGILVSFGRDYEHGFGKK